jgi:hypothetical protein
MTQPQFPAGGLPHHGFSAASSMASIKKAK